ncbi:hypothetical protein ACFQL1_07275 [Halomicroarcula sp. GCM10025709]
MTVTSRFPVGTNVYNRDWDALLILDTCRVDALRAVADEYDFLGDIGVITSVGSTSPEWIANTFRTEFVREIRDTAYVSANAFSKRVIEQRRFPAERIPVAWQVVPAEEFLLLDHAWEYQPETRFKHMLPEHVTDRAITVGRDYDAGRLIIHYSQPHAPYIAGPREEGRPLHPHESAPFEQLRCGETTRRIVWDAYLDNLRMVLDSVELLLENLEAERVAISADHGEAFGEYGVYAHTAGQLSPYVKQVPWVITEATDTGSHAPEFRPGTPRREVETQLRDLGYMP